MCDGRQAQIASCSHGGVQNQRETQAHRETFIHIKDSNSKHSKPIHLLSNSATRSARSAGGPFSVCAPKELRCSHTVPGSVNEK